MIETFLDRSRFLTLSSHKHSTLSLIISLVIKTTIASWPRAAHCCSVRSSVASSSVAGSHQDRHDSPYPTRDHPTMYHCVGDPLSAPLFWVDRFLSSFFGCVWRTPFTRVPDTKPTGGQKGYRGTGGPILSTHMYIRRGADKGMESSNLYAAPIRPLGFRGLGRPVVIPMISWLLDLAYMKIFTRFSSSSQCSSSSQWNIYLAVWSIINYLT